LEDLQGWGDGTSLGVLVPQEDLASANANEREQLARTKSGEEPDALVTLCMMGDVAAVEALLETHGTNGIHEQRPDGSTPLSYALLNGHDAIAEVLLKHGANPWEGLKDEALAATTRNILNMAAQLQSGSPLISLWKLHPDPRAMLHRMDDDGNTVLHIASRLGRAEVCKAVIDACVNDAARNELINMVTEEGRTAIHEAAWYQSLAALKVLTEYFPESVNCLTKDGSTALHCAVAVTTASLDTVKALIAAGAKSQLQNTKGFKASWVAYENGNHECQRYLHETEMALRNPSHDSAPAVD